MYYYIKKSHRLLGVDTGVLEALTPELAVLGVLARQLDALLIADDRCTSVRRNTLLYMTYVRLCSAERRKHVEKSVRRE